MSYRQLQCSRVMILLVVFIFCCAACTQPQPLAPRETMVPTSGFSFRITDEMVPQDRTEGQKQVKTPVEPSQIPLEATSVPTKSVKITPIPTPNPFPAIADNSIKPAHDLLFLSSGELRMWSSQAGQVSPIFQAQEPQVTPVSTVSNPQRGRVAEYRIAGNNQRIVLLRSRGISANGVELFDLELIDITSGTIKVLLEETPAVYKIGISPDGEWVIYTIQLQGGGPIFSIPTNNASEPIRIGVCQAETEHDCKVITWLENLYSVMWNDKDGVWISSPPNFEPVRIIENRVPIIDLEGNDRILEVSFNNLKWSPQGRYILAEINPLRSDIRWQGIIDTLRGKMIEVPGSFEVDEPTAAVGWMPDGDLLVIQNYIDGAIRRTKVTRYNLFPTSDTLLIREQEFALDLREMLPEQDVHKEDIDFIPQYLIPESDRIVWIILVNPQDGIRSRLYHVDLKYRMVTKTYDLPEGEIRYHWSPYNAEAILAVQPEGLYYFEENIQTVLDIKTLLGGNGCCFRWMP